MTVCVGLSVLLLVLAASSTAVAAVRCEATSENPFYCWEVIHTVTLAADETLCFTNALDLPDNAVMIVPHLDGDEASLDDDYALEMAVGRGGDDVQLRNCSTQLTEGWCIKKARASLSTESGQFVSGYRSFANGLDGGELLSFPLNKTEIYPVCLHAVRGGTAKFQMETLNAVEVGMSNGEAKTVPRAEPITRSIPLVYTFSESSTSATLNARCRNEDETGCNGRLMSIGVYYGEKRNEILDDDDDKETSVLIDANSNPSLEAGATWGLVLDNSHIGPKNCGECQLMVCEDGTPCTWPAWTVEEEDEEDEEDEEEDSESSEAAGKLAASFFTTLAAAAACVTSSFVIAS